MAEKNIDSGCHAFPDKNPENEFREINTKGSANIADKIGWQKREGAPADNNRQFVFLENRFYLRYAPTVFPFK